MTWAVTWHALHHTWWIAFPDRATAEAALDDPKWVAAQTARLQAAGHINDHSPAPVLQRRRGSRWRTIERTPT